MKSDILYGKRIVMDMLSKSPSKIEIVWIQKTRYRDVNEILKSCQNNKVKYQFVPKEKLDRICPKKHQGIVAKIFSPGFVDEYELISRLKGSKLPLILALDQVQDQGNIGALARTLYGLGGCGMVITKFRSGQLGERAIKSSSGALLHLPISRTQNLKSFLDLCANNNIFTYFAGIYENCEDVYSINLKLPAVLVLGNEEKGVRRTVRDKCLMGLKIPMLRDFDSLNVAQAGAILIGEFLRTWLKK
ncbi:TrmH family RNA methyltransferase [Desulfothermus naphthae]